MHVAVGDGVCELEEAVGKGRLAVVDMGDDAEVTNFTLIHRLLNYSTLAFAFRYNAGVLGKPLVTLAYAQTLNGMIAKKRGEPLVLSCEASMVMTHKLRAAHDVILVGIGTVLADDPRLTVRLVEGVSPQPVVLDSHLRCPPEAKVVKNGAWIFTTHEASEEKARALMEAGAEIFRVRGETCGRVCLADVIAEIAKQGKQNVMVEGGAAVISSFLKQNLAHKLNVTVVPTIGSGVNVLDGGVDLQALDDFDVDRLGRDLLITATLKNV